jgi:hypothetical protein
MRGLIRTLAAGLAVGGLVAAATLPAGANNSWKGYHWAGTATGDKGLPAQVTVRNHLDGAWSGVLTPVSADWNLNAVIQHTVAAGTTGAGQCALPAAPPTAADYEVDVCNGAFGANGWLGIAEIWVGADGHILTGAVRMNDSYFSQDPYNDPNARRHVLCQEVGHAWGLDHQHGPRAQTCMNDSFGLLSASFVSPNAHDYDQLAAVYCHLGSDPCSTKGGGGPKGKGNGNGKGQVFERRAANGARLVTFILRP